MYLPCISQATGASLSDVASLHNLVTVVDAAALFEQLAAVDRLADRGWQASAADRRTATKRMHLTPYVSPHVSGERSRPSHRY